MSGKITGTLLLVTALGSCTIFNAIKTAKHISKATFDGKNYVEQFSFEMKTGHLAIPVTVNNSVREFYLDIGAPTAISPDLSDELHLPVKTIPGEDSSVTVLPMMKDLTIHGLHYTNVGAVEINTKKMFARSCSQVDGLIGANITSKSIWQIDYANNRISVTDQLGKLDFIQGAIQLPFKPASFTKSPLVTVKLDNGQELKLIIDTGSNGAITFNTDYQQQFLASFEKQQVQRSYSKGYISILGDKDAQAIDTAYVIRSGVLFGTTTIPAQQLTYGRYKNNSERKNGVIGNAFLKQFTVTIDWLTNTLYLFPLPEAKPASGGTFGFSAGFEGERFIIGSLYQGSEAEKKGLKIGDEVLELNGYKISELTPQQVCDYANEKLRFIPDDLLTLTIVVQTASGETKTEELTRYDLFH